MDENEIAYRIIGAGIEVHKHLGPGLLESAYHECLKKELNLQGVLFESEVPISVSYKNEVVDIAYRVDLLVENKVIIELKAVPGVDALHKAQLLTYLRLFDKKLGLLMNFNEIVLKQGICRVVNNL